MRRSSIVLCANGADERGESGRQFGDQCSSLIQLGAAVYPEDANEHQVCV